jgi:glycosyltransferase involved in cell wall biosynthesis
MKSNLDVTVVIPSFNSRNTIRRAIDSVLSQTWRPRELIVVDDFSTDGTYEELQLLFNTEFPINAVVMRNSSNLGPGLSRNIGWNSAKSNWIAFLDADDAWHPQRIELQFRAIDKAPDIDLICSESTLFSNAQASKSFSLDVSLVTIYFAYSIFKNPIPTRSVMMKTKIPFRFPKGLSEDYALWLQCMDAGLKVVKLQAPLAFHFRPEFSKGGLSSQILNHELYELRTLSKYFRKSPVKVTLALFFSILKFCRRVLLKATRRASS